MAELKTDYIDDVLDTEKNTRRKYNMITNSDGTVSLEDVTEYTQVGDSFGSKDINATNEILNKFQSFITGTLKVGYTTVYISDNSITTDSMFDIYTNVYGVNPTKVEVTDGTIILVFDAQATEVEVKVRVM